jgi:DeoR family transcriptional regulator, fructose operon transcriptional repressor
MRKKERQEIIVREVRLHNRISLNELVEMLEVSIDTVRRDIIELEKEKKLERVHGGAQALGYKPYNYDVHEIFFHQEKRGIAGKAVTLITENSVSLISGGTTNLELARIIPDDLTATIFTPSLPIAMQLLEHNNLEVIMLGGRLNSESQIAYGGHVLNSLAAISFDNCFLGTNYLDHESGLTELDWDIVQLKKAMISSSSQIISLTVSGKLGTRQRYKVCNLGRINTLVTELNPQDPKLTKYHQHCLNIL